MIKIDPFPKMFGERSEVVLVCPKESVQVMRIRKKNKRSAGTRVA
jgi:hypothetical protein